MNTTAPPDPATPAVRTEPFDDYVVCIGASAGGLDALEKFFKACPTDLGAAFVVVQHLSPDHKSMMSNLLARHTAMPVTMVEDDMPIDANRVYLIPPGAIMHVTKGHLHLTPKNPRGLTLPIDIFFSSLADVYDRHAVGIILSGTGSDGTRGAMAINAAGGFLMAQEPESAKFDGMPRSVIGTGLVDAILPAEELPPRLIAHIRNLPYKETQLEAARVLPHATMTSEEVMAALLHLLHQVGGIDFCDYKPTTVMRRIDRRMQVRHTPELYQYYELLELDRTEINTLRREILISVTSFFRDPETFIALADEVIGPMVAGKPPGETIRVWIAGVATGEEAYSIGMLFLEACERERRWPNLKIFATDVDQQCVETASIGQYPESAAAEISPERLERFFLEKDERFLVRNELRQCIVFARHNLLSDPPFTKMDLVVCRNTLIYFNAAAQEHALRSLQYAIREGGALLLGSSESLSAGMDGLQTISAKHKLFRRVGTSTLPSLERRAGPLLSPPLLGKPSPLGKARRAASDTTIATTGTATLMSLYAPPAIVVNQEHEAIYLFGDVNAYLHNREGAASLAINRLLPDNLTPVAAALLYKAARDQGSIVSDLIDVVLPGGERRTIRLSAHPLPNDGAERLTMLCFENAPRHIPAAVEPVDVDAETMARVAVLERELAATRESLQATIEELETSNEELQATNEELMASNEELQSSNEELQSVNEEMSTVNAEFQEKMLVLNRTNADLDSMARAAGVATIFLDHDLHVTRFSPDATAIFRLRDTDIGRPLSDIQHILRYPTLMEDLQQTLRSQRSIEVETATGDDQRTYLVRILPYLIPSTTHHGVVATFVDVTAFHDARRLQAIIDALPEHIAVLDQTGTIVLVNAAWQRFARANGDKSLSGCGPGVNYLEVCRAAAPDDPDADAAWRGLRGVLEGTLPLFRMEYPCHSPAEERWFVMNVAPVLSQSIGAVVSHINISPGQRGALPD